MAQNKTGVWVNGILRLQSTDQKKIKEFSEKKMKERDNVWVAPVGSFVQ